MSPPGTAGRRLVSWLVIVAAATYLFTAAGYLASPLRFDEVEWAYQVRGILEHGVPEVTFEESRAVWTRPWLGYDAIYGMWHPPLYLYSLAAAALPFGVSAPVLRATGVAWFAGSLALVWVIAGGLVDRPYRTLAGRLALALCLLSPITAEGSVYLDIDNTALAFGLLLFLALYLRHLRSPSRTLLVLLVAAFAFCLAAKLTTPLLLIGSAGLFHLLDRDWRGMVRAAAIGVAGGALFAAGYWLYCRLLDYPASYMFDISYLGKTAMYARSHGVKLALASLRWHLVWVSLPVVALLALALAVRIAAWRRSRRLEPVDLPLLFAVVVVFAYVPWGGMVGKYAVPAVLAGAAAAAAALAPRLAGWAGPSAPGRLGAWVAALAAVHLLWIPVLRFKPPGSAARTATWAGALGDPRNLHLALAVAVFGLFALAAWRLLPGRRTTALAVLLTIWAGVAPPIEAAKLRATPFELSPYRPLAERGFGETVELLDRILGPDAVILAPKDIGYSFHGRHYPIESVWAYDGPEALRALMRSPAVCAVVDSTTYPLLTAEDLATGLPATATAVPVGSFVVYSTCGPIGRPPRTIQAIERRR